MKLSHTTTETACSFALEVPAADVAARLAQARRMAGKRRPGRPVDGAQLALDLRAELRQVALNEVREQTGNQPAGVSTFEESVPLEGLPYVVRGVMPIRPPEGALVARGLRIVDPGVQGEDREDHLRRAASLALLAANRGVEAPDEAVLQARQKLEQRGAPAEHIADMARTVARLDVLLDRVALRFSIGVDSAEVDGMVRAVAEQAGVEPDQVDRTAILRHLRAPRVLDFLLEHGEVVAG